MGLTSFALFAVVFLIWVFQRLQGICDSGTLEFDSLRYAGMNLLQRVPSGDSVRLAQHLLARGHDVMLVEASDAFDASHLAVSTKSFVPWPICRWDCDHTWLTG